MTTRTTAARTAKKCHKCGRPIADSGCRQVRLGFYCMQWGLDYDSDMLVYPTTEVGKAEQAVRDEYAPHLAQAEALCDAALEQFSAAQSAHLDALAACYRTGAIPPGSKYHLMGVGLGGNVFEMSADGSGWRDRIGGRNRRKLLDAEESARHAFEAAEERLARERTNLSGLERRYDAAVRAARSQDRENRR